MTKNAIEEVRLLAPFVETTSDLGRARQRRKLEDAIAAETTSSRHERSIASSSAAVALRARHVPRRRTYLAGAAAAVAAVGIAIPLSLRTTVPTATRATKTAGPVMELDSYRLRLPSSYRLTAATTVTCPVPFGFVRPGSSPTQWVAVGTASTAQSPDYASQMVAAANAEGSCISIVLAPPYTPTTANPDPDAGVLQNTQSVQVGSYQGRVGTWTLTSEPNSSTVGSSQPALFVEMPVNGGQTQDLVVTADNLSESALVSLVASGLSVTGAAPTTPTAPSSSTTAPAPSTTAPTSGNSGATGNSGTGGNTGTASTSTQNA